MALVYLGLGSNLKTPEQQLIAALRELYHGYDATLVGCSSFYASPPMGPSDQPDYMNAVASIDTALSPLALLSLTQRIEAEQGRVRTGERWGPRTLDIDILLYDSHQIQTPELTVPHYGLCDREFVVLPLMELATQTMLPNGTSLAHVAAQCPKMGLKAVKSRAQVWKLITESV